MHNIPTMYLEFEKWTKIGKCLNLKLFKNLYRIHSLTETIMLSHKNLCSESQFRDVIA